jgi:hypothetical protein
MAGSGIHPIRYPLSPIPYRCYPVCMTPELQTAVALGLVVLAFGYFVARWLRGRKKPGCGGGCGCSGKKF